MQFFLKLFAIFAPVLFILTNSMKKQEDFGCIFGQFLTNHYHLNRKIRHISTAHFGCIFGNFGLKESISEVFAHKTGGGSVTHRLVVSTG